jgi:four helix bundle protein
MKESILNEKSLDFAAQIVLFYQEYSRANKDATLTKQLLRSATSIGANINEANFGNNKADFIAKFHISLKETGESIYWLKLLARTNLIDGRVDELLEKAEEIKRMLVASLNTLKGLSVSRE